MCLYTSVSTSVFAALHREDDDTMAFELEEAYVTFSDFYSIIMPDSKTSLGLGATIGKKLIPVGKVNSLHPEQYAFVDRPIAIQQFFGSGEGLSGEGGYLFYLLPLPFFSQVELGTWTVAAHEEGAGHSAVEYKED